MVMYMYVYIFVYIHKKYTHNNDKYIVYQSTFSLNISFISILVFNLLDDSSYVILPICSNKHLNI